MTKKLPLNIPPKKDQNGIQVLALGGDHVVGRLVGACLILRWILSLRARLMMYAKQLGT